MRYLLILQALLNGAIAAGDGPYNYKYNGADWPDFSSDCGKENQSPIDLRTDWAVESADDDDFNKLYTDQQSYPSDKKLIKAGWTGDTNKVELTNPGNTTQTFVS